MEDVTGLRSSLSKKIAETLQLQSTRIEELEAELVKARKPCLLQISEPAGEYPALPAPDMETAAGMKYYHQGKLYAYVDTDRAMRESARLAETPACEDASYESLNLAKMVLSDCGHSSNYEPLLERVAGRIDRHVERLLTAQQADRAMRAQAAPTAATRPSDLVTRESAMRATEHVAIHNSGSREREAVEMPAEAPTMPPVTPEEFSRDIAELIGTTSKTHVETLTALAEKYDRIVVKRRYVNHKSKIRWIVECGCFINYTEGSTLQEAIEAACQKFLES